MIIRVSCLCRLTGASHWGHTSVSHDVTSFPRQLRRVRGDANGGTIDSLPVAVGMRICAFALPVIVILK
jgi:hypothetical protein